MNRSFFSAAALLLLWSSEHHHWAHAFSIGIIRSSSTSSTSCLSLSSSSSTPPPPPPGDDDEISKLIGRRSQIKRKSKEELPAVDENAEPTVDLDLDKLPEFKTDRPVRRPKASSSDDEEEKDEEQDNKSKQNAAAPIIDYQADYVDENDNLHIPNRLGITTVAWGDPKRQFVAKGKLTKRMLKQGKFVPGDLQLAYIELLQGGVTFMETAPSYGAASALAKLSAEHILGRCLTEQIIDELPEAVIAEGAGMSPWLSLVKSRGSMANAMVNGLEASLTKLGCNLIELYQAPSGGPLFSTTLLCRGLVAAIESGQCNAVGVQGVTSAGKLRKIQRKLEDQEVSLTTNAFDFSLTNRKHVDMIDVCKDAGVIPLITNPLDGGLASGVYTATNPSGGGQTTGSLAKFSFDQLEKLQPLHSVQETVAERVRTRVIRGMRDTQERFKSRYGPPPKINTDITTTQVALNYVIAKGGVPLAQVNSPAQAKEVLGCLGWSLIEEEVDMLDNAADLCKLS